MQWEQLASCDFEQAVNETEVCIVSAGVVEKHGEHLPLGTDYLNAHAIACLAAEIEPAVVFPPFYFGQIYEARCFPGTIAIEPTLLVKLIQGVFDEIGRNGFRKIVVYNGHGGNTYLLPFIAQCALWSEKPYTIYIPRERLTPERKTSWKDICETTEHGHACEYETGISLANHADLVRMDRVPPTLVSPMGRLKHMPPTTTAIRWYSDYPEHCSGDAAPASVEKGKKLRDLLVQTLAEYVAAVKADKVAPELQKEFFTRCESHCNKNSEGCRDD